MKRAETEDIAKVVFNFCYRSLPYFMRRYIDAEKWPLHQGDSIMYYLLIIFSTVLFSFSNLFNASYQKNEGESLIKSFKRVLIGSVFAMVMLVFTGIGNLSFSFFSFMIALLAAINGIACTIISIKIFAIANLTIYSLFSMIGGMLLPFVFSIVFYDEVFTFKKILCVILLILALFIGNPVSKNQGKNSKIAIIYYIGIFISNGMSGVLSKIHQTGENAVSANSYTFMQKAIILFIGIVIMLYYLYRKEDIKFNCPAKSTGFIAGGEILNTIANLILLYALLHVDASVQYPLVTGGVIVGSVLLDFIRGKKPTKRALISVVITCAGMSLLVI